MEKKFYGILTPRDMYSNQMRVLHRTSTCWSCQNVFKSCLDVPDSCCKSLTMRRCMSFHDGWQSKESKLKQELYFYLWDRSSSLPPLARFHSSEMAVLKLSWRDPALRGLKSEATQQKIPGGVYYWSRSRVWVKVVNWTKQVYQKTAQDLRSCQNEYSPKNPLMHQYKGKKKKKTVSGHQ